MNQLDCSYPHSKVSHQGLDILFLDRKYFLLVIQHQLSNYYASLDFRLSATPITAMLYAYLLSAAAPSGRGPQGNSSPSRPETDHKSSSVLGSTTHSSTPHLDVLQEDASAPLILQFHQFLRMLTFFVGLMPEVLGKVLQSHIIPVKIVGLKNKNSHAQKPKPHFSSHTKPSPCCDFRCVSYQPYFRTAGVQAKASSSTDNSKAAQQSSSLRSKLDFPD